MAKTRRLLTNFSKGELSPLVEGRPDLAAYFEGGSVVENFNIMRQGGVDRRVGTRFISEVKDSTLDTILIPFEASVDDAFIIEVGNLYMRFYKNKAYLGVEIATPYTTAQLRNLHFTQSVDILYIFHSAVAQRKLARISDTNWTLTAITYLPPPSYEADTDISGGTATLAPGAVSGDGVTFTASSAVFIQADKNRVIIYGASRAVITQVGPSAGAASPQATVLANILDVFPNTDPIAAGSWLLRGSPQCTLDPDIKAPVGAVVTLVATGVDSAFRTADVGKFITIYAGLVKITVRNSALQVKGELQSEMTGTTDPPPAAPAGAWTLEVASWSAAKGYPRTGDFFQGRLGQASTPTQKTAFWLSESDDYENYAVGTTAARAVEYTVASRQLNQIEWMIDNSDLFLGTSGSEHRVEGGKSDEPLGGDVVPLVRRVTSHGVAPIQPVVIGRRVIFVDRSRKQIFALAFSIEEDGFNALEITVPAEHITGAAGLKLGPLAFARRPNSQIYFVRDDGTLVVLTYFYLEKVIGFARCVTDGLFEAVAVIPSSVGDADQVWVIVKRTINGVVRRYLEMVDTKPTETAARAWDELYTDCAKVYSLSSATTSLTGLTHLEAKTVDIVADGSYRGTAVVASGAITLAESASQHVEVGLHYDSTLTTMRPVIEGQVVEGLPRTWIKLWARLKDTIGGLINSERLVYVPSDLDELDMFTGDRDITGYGGHNTDGRVTVKQDQPYPMKVLAVFGEIEFGEHG